MADRGSHDSSPTVRLTRPHWRAGIIVGVLVGGAVVTVLLRNGALAWEQERTQMLLGTYAAGRAQLLENQMLRSMEVLHSIASLSVTDGPMNAERFRTFVRDALVRQPELGALGWSPRVWGAQRAEFESAARLAGAADFTFTERTPAGKTVPAAKRDEYFPVLFIEPQASNHTAAGFDLASDAVRSHALDLACMNGAPESTPPIRLVQATDDELGFVVYLPVFNTAAPLSVAERHAALRGFASAVFRVRQLLEPIVASAATDGLNIRVEDDSSGTAQCLFCASESGPAASRADLGGTASLDVAGRHWTIVLQPTAVFLAAHSGGSPREILLAGLLLTALLASYLWSLFRRTAEVERRVAQRTIELRREVAERKRAEEGARVAESKYRGIFENSIEGIFQTTPHGHYVSANRSLARIYGYESIKQLVADLTNIAGQLYVDPERRAEFVRLVQRDGVVSGFLSQVRRHDGRVIWISENARAVRDMRGTILHYEGTVVDVTERMETDAILRRHREELENCVRQRTAELGRANMALQAEIAERKRAELSAAAASQAKSDFLARMSHEIRTPMNAILGYAQVLHRDPTVRGSHLDAMRTIISSGNHLLGLIDDILEISKIEAGHVELRPVEFDLRGLLHDLVGMFRQRCEQKRLALVLQGAACCQLSVTGDDRKLRQVLINLLGNAVKFTDEGSVTLRIRAAAAGAFRFEVSDTGIGVPAEACRAIFEPFNQGPSGHQRGGAGLGLAIARQHIEMMGGRLEVFSRHPNRGTGSTFAFTLPFSPARQSGLLECDLGSPAERRIAGLARGHDVHALVVDDVAENRNVLAEMLSAVGCRVTTAPGGAQAIEMMQSALPDIVFLDIMMPVLDGIQTARRIGERFADADTVLVATSASALEHEQRECLNAGFDEFLPKPVECNRLYAVLERLLGVEFEETASEICEPTAPKLTFLSPELRSRLGSAARLYRITDLKRCISDIDCVNIEPHAADFLRQCVRRYDMEAIIQALDA